MVFITNFHPYLGEHVWFTFSKHLGLSQIQVKLISMFWLIYRAMILTHQVFQWGFLSKKGACCWSRKAGVFVGSFSRYLDLMNLMTYDLHGTWEDRTGCVAPLYTTEEDVQLAGGENFCGNVAGGLFVGCIPVPLNGAKLRWIYITHRKSMKIMGKSTMFDDILYIYIYQEKWKFMFFSAKFTGGFW